MSLYGRSTGLTSRPPDVEVRPIDVQDVPHLVGVVGTASGTGCWCQRFTSSTSSNKRQAFEQEVVRSLAPIGLVAMSDGRCVGFSRVAPRDSIPGVAANRALARVLAGDTTYADSAWWISCFAVARSERGHSVGLSLLRGAMDFAYTNGGVVLDGHPVDVDKLKSRPAPSAIFTGTMSMFIAAGFQEIGRTYPSRPVMRARLRQ